jgi:hypothetical protein
VPPRGNHAGAAKEFKMRFVSMLLAVFGTLACAMAEVHYQPVVPPMLLPDGTPFLTWSDLTHYTRTYHVSQNNPLASDENDGTEAHPFRTINHAAQVVKAGERVWIHAGIYRELVQPRLSGEDQDRMIAYEAAPGEQVIVRGSRVVTTKWELSVDPNRPPRAADEVDQNVMLGFPAYIFSKQLWMTTLPDSMFEGGYFPLRMPNITEAEFKGMDWALKWMGRFPYVLPRGMLFQDGRRMVQMAAYEDLVRLPGSFWVAPDRKTVHIHPFGNANPNGRLFEAAVQPYLIQPQTSGVNFIRISGLTLEHCANGFRGAALGTRGGNHWIIEGNTLRQVNAVGMDPGSGYNIIRRNRISDCGTAGMHGSGAQALVEDNEVVDCGWQDAEFHWEVAGIKLFGCRGALVRHNHVARILGGDGIWLDWGNQNSRITGNVLHDITTVQGALYVEASPIANMVDHNFLWNINGQGVRLADSDNAIVAHNFFARVSEELVASKVATDRSLNGRKLTSTGNRVVNNVVVDQGKPILFQDPSNVADYNVYVSTQADRTAVKDAGGHSVAIHAEVTFDEGRLLLSWKSDSPLPTAPILKGFELDFFGLEPTADQNVPGPFLGLANPVTFQLRGDWK